MAKETEKEDALGRWQKVCQTTDEESRINMYDDIAASYDQDSNTLEWTGPLRCAQFIYQQFKDQYQIRILDVCAGSGLVAQELKKFNFTNIDFLDGSRQMTIIAMQKNLYKRYICEILDENSPCIISNDSYDAVVMSGGHISPGKGQEMTRITKPGGICLATVFLEGPKDEGEYESFKKSFLEVQRNIRLCCEEKVEKISCDEKGGGIPGLLVAWKKETV